jgi:hypothetical protein
MLLQLTKLASLRMLIKQQELRRFPMQNIVQLSLTPMQCLGMALMPFHLVQFARIYD